MTISERLFSIMEEKNISIPDLSRMTGISRHTIFDWRKKNTNPGADKVMIICDALRILPDSLLEWKDGEQSRRKLEKDYVATVDRPGSKEPLDFIIEQKTKELSENQKRRLLAYLSMLENQKEESDAKGKTDL